MTQPLRPNFRLFPIALALAAGVAWPLAASAQSAPAPAAGQAVQPDPSAPPADPNVVRLTDAERNAILDSNTEDKAAAARGELTGIAHLVSGIHGEVGMMIGSNGMRGVYGMADIPLGEDGDVIVAYQNMQYGRRR